MNRAVLLAAIMATATGNLASNPKQSPAHRKQEIAQQPPADMPPVTVRVQNPQSPEPTKTPKPETPQWYATPEGALVVVGIITFIVIGWQSWETRKAAEASRESIKLQEAAMRQWIELSNWKAEFNEPGTTKLEIEVDVYNPTNYPLTLQETMLRLNGQKQRDAVKYRLSPKQAFPVPASVSITGEQLSEKYMGNGLTLVVTGAVKFVDVLGDSQVQRFKGLLECSVNWESARFHPMGTSKKKRITPSIQIRTLPIKR